MNAFNEKYILHVQPIMWIKQFMGQIRIVLITNLADT
jgi:hypothetical protein